MKRPRILCAIDFSDYSIKALQWAAALATFHETEIIAIHVMRNPMIPSPGVGIMPSYYWDGRPSALSRLQELLKPLRVKYESIVTAGVAAEEIVRNAEEFNVFGIVMGTHGLSGISHRLMGSVSEEVIRTSVTPVITISPNCSSFNDTYPPKVLLAVAETEEHVSLAGVRLREVTQELAAEVFIVHVVDSKDKGFAVNMYRSPFAVPTRDIAGIEKQLLKVSARRLHQPPAAVLVKFGDPAVQIVQEAENGYDYIVMDAALNRLFSRVSGSCIYEVIRRSSIPVITLKKLI